MERYIKGAKVTAAKSPRQLSNSKKRWKVDKRLRPHQLTAFRVLSKAHRGVLAKRNFVAALTTAYGKSLILYYAIYLNAIRGGKSIVTVPLKALGEQFLDYLREYYDVLEVTGDTRSDKKNAQRIKSGDYDVILTTYEKLELTLNSTRQRDVWGIGSKITLVGVDEGHMIRDRSRGGNLESCLLILRRRYPQLQLVVLSATIGDEEMSRNYADWLDANLVYCPLEDRPTKLVPAIRTYPEMYGQAGADNLIIQEVVDTFKGEPGGAAQVIVFARSHERVEMLQRTIQSRLVREGLSNLNVRFIHANLDKDVKRRLVEGFTARTINVLVATTAIAAGVDTPCQKVVVADPARWNWLTSEWEILDHQEFQQMCGRVRQPLSDGFGHATAICSDEQEQDVWDRLTNPGTIESQIPGVLRQKITSWVVASLGGRVDLDWMMGHIYRATIAPDQRERDIEWLIEHSFIRVAGEDDQNADELARYRANRGMPLLRLVPTIWGVLVSQYAMLPETLIHLRITLSRISELGTPPIPEQMFSVLLDTPQFKDIVVVRNKPSDADAVRLGRHYSRGFARDPRLCKAFAMTFSDYIVATEEEAGNPKPKFGTSSGDKRKLVESASRLIACAERVAKIQKCAWYDKVAELQVYIGSGTLDATIALLKQVDGIGDTYAKKLKDAGVDTLLKLAKSSDAEMIGILGNRVKNKVGDIKASALRVMMEKENIPAS